MSFTQNWPQLAAQFNINTIVLNASQDAQHDHYLAKRLSREAPSIAVVLWNDGTEAIYEGGNCTWRRDVSSVSIPSNAVENAPSPLSSLPTAA